jgi:translation elongation factor EF-G
VGDYDRFPLRQLLCDPTQRFQLAFAEQGALMLEGFSGLRTQRTPRGLVLMGVAERDLDAAAAMIQAAFPAAQAGAAEVVLLNEGAAEPYVRVTVAAPEDCYGDIVGQLAKRGGLIEDMGDMTDGNKRVTATAPLARMLGYDGVLASVSRNRATIDYVFVGYRPSEQEGPTMPPRTPAARA